MDVLFNDLLDVICSLQCFSLISLRTIGCEQRKSIWIISIVSLLLGQNDWWTASDNRHAFSLSLPFIPTHGLFKCSSLSMSLVVSDPKFFGCSVCWSFSWLCMSWSGSIHYSLCPLLYVFNIVWRILFCNDALLAQLDAIPVNRLLLLPKHADDWIFSGSFCWVSFVGKEQSFSLRNFSLRLTQCFLQNVIWFHSNDWIDHPRERETFLTDWLIEKKEEERIDEK